MSKVTREEQERQRRMEHIEKLANRREESYSWSRYQELTWT